MKLDEELRFNARHYGASMLKARENAGRQIFWTVLAEALVAILGAGLTAGFILRSIPTAFFAAALSAGFAFAITSRAWRKNFGGWAPHRHTGFETPSVRVFVLMNVFSGTALVFLIFGATAMTLQKFGWEEPFWSFAATLASIVTAKISLMRAFRIYKRYS